VVLALVPGNSERGLLWKLIALALWLGLVDGWLEFARADLVMRGQRRAALGIGRAFALLGQPRLALAALAVWLLLSAVSLGFWAASALTVAALPIPAL